MLSESTVFVVVPDQPCPGCGAYWGNPDPKLDFPNRIKVDNDWKCYNPECEVGFYRDGMIVEYKPSPERLKEIYEETRKSLEGIQFKQVGPNTWQGYFPDKKE